MSFKSWECGAWGGDGMRRSEGGGWRSEAENRTVLVKYKVRFSNIEDLKKGIETDSVLPLTKTGST